VAHTFEAYPDEADPKAPKEIVKRRAEANAPPLPKPNRIRRRLTDAWTRWSARAWPKRANFVLQIPWKLAVIVATFLGIVSGWVAMVPRVSITQSQALNASDPFSTPFIVENQGPLPMMDVRS
jgi:kynureninase